ncbi:nitrate reductase cytochrome c-type subunit [Parashewanella tropica]|uniref:nitrate reductase cytochrome c-type subunit n=1 Tax=Parashewanella tropica TaxID=2547970 RepID=UPI0010597B77|nr:nitrate reductase cytochrome c-type subunit [Parashewanella tropica]
MKTFNKSFVKVTALLTLASAAFIAVGAGTDKTIRGDHFATLRHAPLNTEPTPPPLSNEKEHQGSLARNYPAQAPIIPHQAHKYQIDRKVNQCLSCHDRSRVHESKAPMIGISHYLTRDNHFLAQVSPRRYFCTQCHVSQENSTPLVNNTFVDVDKLVEASANKKQH